MKLAIVFAAIFIIIAGGAYLLARLMAGPTKPMRKEDQDQWP